MKVGEYIRTNEGIRKIEKIYKYDVLTDILFNEYSSNLNDRKDLENQIIKSSPNIIDLIEVGDYVNGMPVLHKENDELVSGLLLRYKNENINSVVTKEQFESMEYKVGE